MSSADVSPVEGGGVLTAAAEEADAGAGAAEEVTTGAAMTVGLGAWAEVETGWATVEAGTWAEWVDRHRL
jgi:hypothetical protein